ncbi:hypothetical protein VNO77_19229 [Canavalia gladiata]|uniref:Uncharacterized protein n=1 Tax=Canavalia gladiata TaxID=3824 RepID=A0AAN9LM37_CANGL
MNRLREPHRGKTSRRYMGSDVREFYHPWVCSKRCGFDSRTFMHAMPFGHLPDPEPCNSPNWRTRKTRTLGVLPFRSKGVTILHIRLPQMAYDISILTLLGSFNTWKKAYMIQVLKPLYSLKHGLVCDSQSSERHTQEVSFCFRWCYELEEANLGMQRRESDFPTHPFFEENRAKRETPQLRRECFVFKPPPLNLSSILL